MRTLCLVATLLCCTPAWGDLRAYAERADASFAWKLLDVGQGANGDVYHLHLTSQTWQGSTWQHGLHLFVPKQRGSDLALLFVGSGPRDGHKLARRLRATVAVLQQVPNQPLLGGKYEDDLIAETFMRFLAGGEEDWPLLLPMVKSVTRAMDALQAFGRERGIAISGFVLTGASKRGWTSWLSAAIDERVRGIAPRVIDMLNLPAQMPHQLASWGRYSEMLGPYTRPGLPNFIDSPAGRRLVELVDPYAYRDRLAMPKLIVLGTNDRYWPLDALNLYWSGLSGPKNVLYVPNAGHDLDDEARWQSSLLCFFHAVAQKQALPTVQASVRPLDGRLQASARAEAPALQARLWFAQAPTRDFREAVWSCIPMRRAGATWMADIARAPQDYAATFAALRFDLAGEACSLSSPAQIHDPQTR